MALIRNLGLAFTTLARATRTYRARAKVAERAPRHPLPSPGSIDIAVYFADTKVNLYQIRQWYGPLAELSRRWPVAIVSRSPNTALTLWDEAPVPSVYARSVADLETFVYEQNPRIVLYVNQNSRNFQMFRYGRMWHVFINHGESDKVYMTTNQVKSYDYTLVAGEAAIERLRSKVWDFDVESRVIPIGRPQADHLVGEPPFTPDDRTVVLYAPTWEGDRPTAAYGSIASHGVTLTAALLASGRHRLVYRPHPRSGVIDPAYAKANRAIISAITHANADDPTAHHVFDNGNELGWQLAVADVAITDISAMVYDRLATGRPLIVTRPVSPAAEMDLSGYLGAAEWLDSHDAAQIVDIGERVQVDVEAQNRLEYWVDRHFGDTRSGAATARFHAAIDLLMTRWDTQSSKYGHEGAEPSEEDDLADDFDLE